MADADATVLVTSTDGAATLFTGPGRAIAEACGGTYQAYVREVLATRVGRPLEQGEVLVTGAGLHRHARWVAHVALFALGTPGRGPCPDVVRAACLALWADLEARGVPVTVAMVALAAGTGKLGVETSVRIACETLATHSARTESSRITKVTFLAASDVQHRLMEHAVEAALGPLGARATESAAALSQRPRLHVVPRPAQSVSRRVSSALRSRPLPELRVLSSSVAHGDDDVLVASSTTSGALASGPARALAAAYGPTFEVHVRSELTRTYGRAMLPGRLLLTRVSAKHRGRWFALVAVRDDRRPGPVGPATIAVVEDGYRRLWRAVEGRGAALGVGLVALGAGNGGLGLRASIRLACATLDEHLVATPASSIARVTFHAPGDTALGVTEEEVAFTFPCALDSRFEKR